MLPLILLLPLAVAMLLISLLRSDMKARYIALAASLASLALLPLVSYGTNAIAWFSAGQYSISITTSIAPINMLLLGIVLFIGVLIMYYSSGYMEKPSEQKRFYLEMLAFEAAMLAFAMAGNFILLFIAWEFLSLTSYLLIGFWYREKPARAARKAITIIVIGDIALLAAMVTLLASTGTLDFGALTSAHTLLLTKLSMGLLILAIMTKSAQFPFQEWLADAMEGPTPVSAYLHSTTMVKAGVFVAIVLSPVFVATGTAYLFVPIGIATAVLAMFNAMRENQIKRIIAYSTVQELGLMLAAVGVGAVSAAIYFFLAQAFYKALLFFSAGGIMKATEKDQLNDVSGLTHNKLLYFTTIFGVLSVAGFIPFDGFFANVALAGAFAANLAVFVVITLIGLGTSFYIFRWLTHVTTETAVDSVRLNYEGLPRSMVYSALVLAPLTLLASLAFYYLPAFFASNSGTISYASMPLNLLGAVIVTALAVAGASSAYWVYGKSRIKALPKLIDGVVHNTWIFNGLYKYAAVFVSEVADGLATFDGYLSSGFDMIGRDTLQSGMLARRMAIGRINQYALVIAVALIVIFAYIYAISIL